MGLCTGTIHVPFCYEYMIAEVYKRRIYKKYVCSGYKTRREVNNNTHIADCGGQASTHALPCSPGKGCQTVPTWEGTRR